MLAIIFSLISYRFNLLEHPLKSFRVLLVGVAGAVDRECWADPGGEGPVLHATTDPYWPNPELHYPADIPLHLWEQENGHHSAGEGQSCNSFGLRRWLMQKRECYCIHTYNGIFQIVILSCNFSSTLIKPSCTALPFIYAAHMQTVVES